MAFAQDRRMDVPKRRGSRVLALLALPLLGAQAYFVIGALSALASARRPVAQRQVEAPHAWGAKATPVLAPCAIDLAKVRNVFDSSARPIDVVPVTGRGDEGVMLADIVARIHRLSDTQFLLERTVMWALLNEGAKESPRIVIAGQGPRAEGIVLIGIRPHAPFGALGLRNGDRLETVNGCGIPDDALEAYAQLRQASNLRVTVNRDGSQLTLDYSIW